MRKSLGYLVIAVSCILLASPALAGGPKHYPRGRGHAGADHGMFRLGLGLFTPDGDSELWDQNAIDFTGDAEDLEDLSVTGEYLRHLNHAASVHFTIGYFEGETTQAYRDFVDENGFDILHDSRLSITPLTVGITLFPAGRQRSIAPYLGAGGGFYWWRYREAGDFILFDEFNEPVEIVTTAFESDGLATGYYLLAGLDLVVSPEFSVFLEGRWQKVDDELDRGFEGFGEIDLSGSDLRAGLAWRF